MDLQLPVNDDDYRISAYIDSTTKAVVMANLVGLFVVLGSWGYYRKFLRRDTEGMSGLQMEDVLEELENVLSLSAKNDDHFCGLRLICELHARRDQRHFGKMERNIVAVFRGVNSTSLHEDNIVNIYRRAARLGTMTDSHTCRDIYNSCQLQQNDLSKIVAAANKLYK